MFWNKAGGPSTVSSFGSASTPGFSASELLGINKPLSSPLKKSKKRHLAKQFDCMSTASTVTLMGDGTKPSIEKQLHNAIELFFGTQQVTNKLI